MIKTASKRDGMSQIVDIRIDWGQEKVKATQNGETIGLLSFYENMDGTTIISGAYVEEDHRRKGICYKMNKYLLKYMKEDISKTQVIIAKTQLPYIVKMLKEFGFRTVNIGRFKMMIKDVTDGR